MKKLISVMLIVLITISLFGCANNQSTANDETKVKNALVGTWRCQTKDGVKTEGIGWSFNADGTASSYAFGPGSDGTYVIEDGKIILTYDNGKSATFIYSFNNGEFMLKGEAADWWNLYKLSE